MQAQTPENRLRELRLRRDLTLQQVAERCEVYGSTVKRWEDGAIPQQYFGALADLLNVSVAYLIGWEPASPEPDREAA
jgi:transcriptional regulator with XRE-family HTH domain